MWVKFSQEVKVAKGSDGRFGTQFGALGLAVGAFGALPPVALIGRQMPTGQFGAPNPAYFFPARMYNLLLFWVEVISIRGFCVTAKKTVCRPTR